MRSDFPPTSGQIPPTSGSSECLDSNPHMAYKLESFFAPLLCSHSRFSRYSHCTILPGDFHVKSRIDKKLRGKHRLDRVKTKELTKKTKGVATAFGSFFSCCPCTHGFGHVVYTAPTPLARRLISVRSISHPETGSHYLILLNLITFPFDSYI